MLLSFRKAVWRRHQKMFNTYFCVWFYCALSSTSHWPACSIYHWKPSRSSWRIIHNTDEWDYQLLHKDSLFTLIMRYMAKDLYSKLALDIKKSSYFFSRNVMNEVVKSVYYQLKHPCQSASEHIKRNSNSPSGTPTALDTWPWWWGSM